MPFYNASIKARTASPLKPKPSATGADTSLPSPGAETKTSAVLSALSGPTAAPIADGEEPINPSSPTPEAKDDEASRPTSPRPLSPQLKDLRAFEHERQKAKRASEWALKMARKTNASTQGGDNPGGKKKGVQGGHTSGGHARTGSTDVGREDVDVEFVLGGQGKLSATGMKDDSGPLAFAIAGAAMVSPMPTPKPKVDAKPLSVSLSDLIVPPKSKSQIKAKAKKSKAKSKSNLTRFGSLGSRRKGPVIGEDDTFSYASTDVDLDALDDEDDEDEDEEEEEFEWVPALRAVIALDEVDPHGRRDMEVDEPWECVGPDGEGEKGEKRGLSYAEVLSGVHLD
ncbi:hypothetical protein CVT26_011515 [Gymnopilus dilepis]|uniref:Uncharacterized protein n=1 Tax=Gymnopilus dilepis TaxID=231916 RepID=A0A409W5G7_9AGAR|nr:hypothetical protein CVT26_011515 [Gymnopilus dilepis]